MIELKSQTQLPYKCMKIDLHENLIDIYTLHDIDWLFIPNFMMRVVYFVTAKSFSMHVNLRFDKSNI